MTWRRTTGITPNPLERREAHPHPLGVGLDRLFDVVQVHGVVDVLELVDVLGNDPDAQGVTVAEVHA